MQALLKALLSNFLNLFVFHLFFPEENFSMKIVLQLSWICLPLRFESAVHLLKAFLKFFNAENKENLHCEKLHKVQINKIIY